MEKVIYAEHLQFLNYLPNEPNVLFVQENYEKYLLIVNEDFNSIRKTHIVYGLEGLLKELKVIEKVRIYRSGELLSTRQFVSDLLISKGFNPNIVPNILFHAFEPLVVV